jgi:hypothetical protein
MLAWCGHVHLVILNPGELQCGQTWVLDSAGLRLQLGSVLISCGA